MEQILTRARELVTWLNGVPSPPRTMDESKKKGDSELGKPNVVLGFLCVRFSGEVICGWKNRC